jgi:hypothetical protein
VDSTGDGGITVRLRRSAKAHRRAAAVLAIALGLVLAPAASGSFASAATDSETAASGDWVLISISRRCVGVEVRRCVQVERRSDPFRIRASAGIRDVDGGSDYSVAVHDVQLQRLVNGSWAFVSGSLVGDYDGWWPVRDVAHGLGRDPACGEVKYRALAHFQWQGPSPADQWLASDAATIISIC